MQREMLAPTYLFSIGSNDAKAFTGHVVVDDYRKEFIYCFWRMSVVDCI